MGASRLSISRALREVKTRKGRIAELDGRIRSASSWRSDKPSIFDFAQLVAERSSLVSELLKLKEAIAVANATHQIDHQNRSMTITGGITLMGELKSQLALFQNLTLRNTPEKEGAYNETTGRYEYETYEWKSVMTELERDAKVQELRKEISDLNDTLEDINHGVKLVVELSS